MDNYTKMAQLTKKQRDILSFIWCYQLRNRIAPTYLEIALRFQISRSTAFEHVHNLMKKGCVKSKGCCRGMYITKIGSDAFWSYFIEIYERET